MDGFIWVLLVGVTGWLTGKLIGEKGYGKVLGEYASNGLDIVFGIIGAFIGSYLFLWAVNGQGNSLSRYATAVLGSITLVGVTRQISVKCLFSGSRQVRNRHLTEYWCD